MRTKCFNFSSNKTVLKLREAMSTYDQYDTVPDDRFGATDKDWLILKKLSRKLFLIIGTVSTPTERP